MNTTCIFKILYFIQYFMLVGLYGNTANGRGIEHRTWTQQQMNSVYLEDLAITVKTTKKYHHSRLLDVIDTWFEDAPVNTFFVTDDADDPTLQARLHNHLVGTNCGKGHDHKSLNCKLQKELELLGTIDAKWSCRFDDDNYVNVDRLLKTLSKYDASQPVYLGRSTIEAPIQIGDMQVWFATGGAGVCFSRPLLRRMYPYLHNFTQLMPGFSAPDDVTLGYLIDGILGVPLTVENSFHSHLHKLELNQLNNLQKQATLGPVESLFWRLNPMSSEDTRLFYSIHCHIFKHRCPQLKERALKR